MVIKGKRCSHFRSLIKFSPCLLLNYCLSIELTHSLLYRVVQQNGREKVSAACSVFISASVHLPVSTADYNAISFKLTSHSHSMGLGGRRALQRKADSRWKHSTNTNNGVQQKLPSPPYDIYVTIQQLLALRGRGTSDEDNRPTFHHPPPSTQRTTTTTRPQGALFSHYDYYYCCYNNKHEHGLPTPLRKGEGVGGRSRGRGNCAFIQIYSLGLPRSMCAIRSGITDPATER